jgi:hypothetical protein
MSQLNLGELSVYVRDIPSLPIEKQNVWNLIGRGKAMMDSKLQQASLALQGIIAGWESKDQPAIEAALQQYKAGYASLAATRKAFTIYLDGAKKQCMRIEEQYDPEVYEPFVKAKARELELRVAATAAAAATKSKAQEEAEFKSFVENEYLDIADDYRYTLMCLIHQTYTACLSAKTPVDKAQPAANTCVAAMQGTQPRKMKTFARKLLSTEEAMVIFKAIRKPDYTARYNDAIKELQGKFALYANDLANAEQAVAVQTNLFEQTEATAKAQNEADKAAVTLVNAATSMSIMPAGMKEVTDVTEIKIIDNDWGWVIRIDVAFAANLEKCKDKVKVKKLSGLTSAQKAAALDAAGVKVSDVEYITYNR